MPRIASQRNVFRYFSKRQEMRTIPEISIDTLAVIEILEVVEENEIITYSELSERIGRDIRKDARSCLYTALRHLQRDYSRLFGVIKSVGLRRLNDSDILSLSVGMRRKHRRQVERDIAKIELANDENLSDSQRASKYSFIGQKRAIIEAEKEALRKHNAEARIAYRAAVPVLDLVNFGSVKAP
jgi:hypothetical protein